MFQAGRLPVATKVAEAAADAGGGGGRQVSPELLFAFKGGTSLKGSPLLLFS